MSAFTLYLFGYPVLTLMYLANFFVCVHAGKPCTNDHAAKIARPDLKKERQRRRKKKSARLVLSRIMEADEGGDNVEDNALLCSLIGLEEANYYTHGEREGG